MTLVRSLAAAGVMVAEQVRVGDLAEHRLLGAEWRARGYQAVIAAGGDGTIGTVATQIAGTELPLGILPLGTSNDTARALGIPLDLDAASAVIAQGTPTPIAIGEVLPRAMGSSLTQADVPNQGKVFLHALTLGLNVAFARLATDVAQRRRWGKLTYAAAAIEALTQFAPVPITIHVSHSNGTEVTEAATSRTYQVLQLAMVNLPLFGGALQLRLPGAVVGRGLLDMVMIKALEPPQLRAVVERLLAALSQLAEWGSAASEPGEEPLTDSDEALGFAMPGVRRSTVRSVLIETPEPVGVTLDGEVRAETPVLVRVAAQPLPVLLPSQARAPLGSGGS
jgi:diacylglycerol kinase family enzyme